MYGGVEIWAEEFEHKGFTVVLSTYRGIHWSEVLMSLNMLLILHSLIVCKVRESYRSLTLRYHSNIKVVELIHMEATIHILFPTEGYSAWRPILPLKSLEQGPYHELSILYSDCSSASLSTV